MQANTLISSSIKSIHPVEDGNKALEMMDQFRIHHLAIVKNNFYLGVISDKEIMSWNSEDDSIEEHLTNLAAARLVKCSSIESSSEFQLMISLSEITPK
jgi:acetoin utilization protein AcuB